MKKITFIAIMAILAGCIDYQVMDEPTLEFIDDEVDEDIEM